MKRIATASLVLLGLMIAASAMALNLQKALPHTLRNTHPVAPASVNSVLGCDDGILYNGYFQGTEDRLGNLFSFAPGTKLSRVGFYHYGFGTPGPYNYDIEIWDPASCTFVAAKNNLVAADAANNLGFEDIDLCPDNVVLSGDLLVTIDPNTCAAPNDCYPDLLFDDQLDVACPWIINSADSSPACFDVSPYSGPFVLRIDVNNCPVPTAKKSWGSIKSMYR